MSQINKTTSFSKPPYSVDLVSPFVKDSNDNCVLLFADATNHNFRCEIVRKMNDDDSIFFNGKFTRCNNDIYFNGFKIASTTGFNRILNDQTITIMEGEKLIEKFLNETVTSLNS